jgi:RecA-family ATPase
LIKTHSVRENDNVEMETVVSCYDEIAEKGNCAISLWHHTNKSGGGERTVESARGASSLIDACRSTRILETMTDREATTLKLEKGKGAKFYFRGFSGRLTFAPPIEKSTWYQLFNIELDNGGALFG